MLTRKLIRVIGRGVLLLALLGALLLALNSWYDFLPPALQPRLLQPKHAVLVDLKIEKCGGVFGCGRSGTQFLNFNKIDKDLHLGQSWFRHAYLYTRYANRDELDSTQLVVQRLAASPNKRDPPPEVIAEAEAATTNSKSEAVDFEAIGWKHAGDGLWVKYGRPSLQDDVSDLKVLFSMSAVCPLPGYTLTRGSLDIGKAQPRLAFRRGPPPPEEEAPKLKFNKNGKFKLAQLADLHMSTSWGSCDCPVPRPVEGEECMADLRTKDLVEDVLRLEQPDFVVFSGDQIYADSSPDPETSLLKALAPVLEARIPFALIFGNHDETKQMPRAEMMRYVTQMPLFVGSAGPEDVPGVGNYVVKVGPPSTMGSSSLEHNPYPALLFYMLDSHSRLPEPHTVSVYDWIKEEQLSYLRQEHDAAAARLENYPHIPLAQAFVHIPVPEFRDDLIDEGGRFGLTRIGRKREGVVAPSFDLGTLDVLRSIGVTVLSVGHDHANDYCQLEQAESGDYNIWMCYGGGTGEGGYGGYPDENGLDYERRVRLYEYDMNLASIDTWQRVQNHDTVVNPVRLVTGGKAVYVAKEDPKSRE